MNLRLISILGEENLILFFTFASCGSSVNKSPIYFDVKFFQKNKKGTGKF